jgi:hypothetical protein
MIIVALSAGSIGRSLSRSSDHTEKARIMGTIVVIDVGSDPDLLGCHARSIPGCPASLVPRIAASASKARIPRRRQRLS